MPPGPEQTKRFWLRWRYEQYLSFRLMPLVPILERTFGSGLLLDSGLPDPLLLFPSKFLENFRFHVMTGCWIWMLSFTDRGYSQCKIKDGDVLHYFAHTYTHDRMFGRPLPGAHRDHECRIHPCANPFHLEAVTPGENTKRGVEDRTGVRRLPIFRPVSELPTFRPVA